MPVKSMTASESTKKRGRPAANTKTTARGTTVKRTRTSAVATPARAKNNGLASDGTKRGRRGANIDPSVLKKYASQAQKMGSARADAREAYEEINKDCITLIADADSNGVPVSIMTEAIGITPAWYYQKKKDREAGKVARRPGRPRKDEVTPTAATKKRRRKRTNV